MLRTGAEFLESLDDGRQVILDGEVVKDIANHPAFAGAARTVAGMYDAAIERPDIYCSPDPDTGEPVHRWWMTPRSREDLAARRQSIEALSEQTCGFLGRSPDHVASFFAGFAGSLPTFAAGGQQFADNVSRFHRDASRSGQYVSYVIIHPTVDRTRAPHEQYLPNLYVSVAGERDGGIVLRGAQMLGTGSVLSDWIFVSCILPLPKGSEDYAISLVVPAAAPGLRIYPRRSYASGNTGGFDYPLSSRFDETDSLMVFDDVFVPWEDVFVYRDIDITAAQFHKTAAHSIGNTQAQIRFAVKTRFYAGLARRIADGSGGLADVKNRQRLGQFAGKAHLPYSFVLAAEANSFIDEFGVARPDPAVLYAAMSLQPQLMNDLIYALRDMAGGSVIQLPSSFGSYDDPVAAADIDRYIRWPNASSDERVKLLKLVWDAVGSEFAGRHLQYEMFYAGEPGVVAMRSFNNYPWGGATDLVDRCLAGVVPLEHPSSTRLCAPEACPSDRFLTDRFLPESR